MPGGAIWEEKICAEGSQSATDDGKRLRNKEVMQVRSFKWCYRKASVCSLTNESLAVLLFLALSAWQFCDLSLYLQKRIVI